MFYTLQLKIQVYFTFGIITKSLVVGTGLPPHVKVEDHLSI